MNTMNSYTNFNRLHQKAMFIPERPFDANKIVYPEQPYEQDNSLPSSMKKSPRRHKKEVRWNISNNIMLYNPDEEKEQCSPDKNKWEIIDIKQVELQMCNQKAETPSFWEKITKWY